jgi:hypothetical protein
MEPTTRQRQTLGGPGLRCGAWVRSLLPAIWWLAGDERAPVLQTAVRAGVLASLGLGLFFVRKGAGPLQPLQSAPCLNR